MLFNRKKIGTKKSSAVRQKTRREPTVLIRLLPKIMLTVVIVSSGYGLNKLFNNLNAFPVEQVRIEGEFVYLSQAQISGKISDYSTGGFFDVDIDRIRTELLAMEWVEDAFVRREWPDTLVIRVVEKMPVALWNKSGVLTATGELFHPQVMPEQHAMVLLRGPSGRHKYVLSEFNRMQSMLRQIDVVVDTAEQDERRSWQLLINGVTVNLGRKDTLKKLENFVNVYAGLIQPKIEKIRQIDLRYSNGIAVSWKKQAAVKEPGDILMKIMSGNSDFASGAMSYV